MRAGAVVRSGTDLLRQIEANKGKIGDWQAITNSAVLSTPWADKDTQGLHAALSLFAGQIPGMEGLRGNDRVVAFQQAMGGIITNQAALEAGVQAAINTAHDINPYLRGAGTPGGSQAAPSAAAGPPAPERPKSVPPGHKWNPATRTWQPQPKTQ